MKYWCHTTKNLFTVGECLNIRNEALKLPPQQATIGHGGKSIVDTSFRTSTVRWVNPTDPKFHYAHVKIAQEVLRANSINYGFDVSGPLEYQFTEYSGENSGYNEHQDNDWFTQQPFDRKLSVVVPLSLPDEFEGGRLTFDLKEQPEALNTGDVIIFPSFLKHRVEPLHGGTRYSIVAWWTGPTFR